MTKRRKPAAGKAPQKIDSSDPAARDEGPRLIPWGERRAPTRPIESNERYLALADAVIKPKKAAED